MNADNNKRIFEKLSEKHFKPKQAVEVGVYLPETSNIYDYIQMGVECVLVEPDPKSIKAIKAHFSGKANVKLIPVAVYDRSGTIELTQRNASTFVTELPNSPTQTNDTYKKDEADTFVAEAKTFDEIDDGNIDLLSVDIEGGEWFVIKHMVSRPAVISLETHGGAYINPYLQEITDWMNVNNYRIFFKDKTDTVFVNDAITVSVSDKLKRFLMNIYIEYQRQRKRLKLQLFAK